LIFPRNCAVKWRNQAHSVGFLINPGLLTEQDYPWIRTGAWFLAIDGIIVFLLIKNTARNKKQPNP
jgi:hypothetical protein